MTTYTSKVSLSILRQLVDGPKNVADIAAALGVDEKSASRRMGSLLQHKRVERDRSGGTTAYAITRKGLVLVCPIHQEPERGNFPEPRTPPSGEVYVPRPIATRPGAMDAYTLPSLVDGKKTPRARPVLMGTVK